MILGASTLGTTPLGGRRSVVSGSSLNGAANVSAGSSVSVSAGLIRSVAAAVATASVCAVAAVLTVRGAASVSPSSATVAAGRLNLASAAQATGSSVVSASGVINGSGTVLDGAANVSTGSAVSALGRMTFRAAATASTATTTTAAAVLVSSYTPPPYTTAQRLRLAGFRASLSVRGMTLSLNGTGKTCKFLLNPAGKPQGEWEVSKEESASDELHVLREHLAGQAVVVGDVWTDALRKTSYRVTDITDRPVNIAVVFSVTTAPVV